MARRINRARGRRMVVSEAFSKRLLDFLRDNSMTNADFAELSELSPSSIGRCTNPGYSVLSGVIDRINQTMAALENPKAAEPTPPQKETSAVASMPAGTLVMLLAAYFKPVIAAEDDAEQAELMRDVLEEVKRRLTTP